MKEISSCSLVVAAICASFLVSCNSGQEKSVEYKAVVQRALEAMNNQDYSALRETIGDSYVRHCQATPDAVVDSYEDFEGLVKEWYRAFPDAKQSAVRMAVEGDLLAFEVTFEGTQTGEMNGLPPTGKKVYSEAFGFHRFEKGKIVETWVTWDNVAILTQLGVFPASGG